MNKTKLQKIIKEEIQAALNEEDAPEKQNPRQLVVAAMELLGGLYDDLKIDSYAGGHEFKAADPKLVALASAATGYQEPLWEAMQLLSKATGLEVQVGYGGPDE